jgi:hypothetical protein
VWFAPGLEDAGAVVDRADATWVLDVEGVGPAGGATCSKLNSSAAAVRGVGREAGCAVRVSPLPCLVGSDGGRGVGVAVARCPVTEYVAPETAGA